MEVIIDMFAYGVIMAATCLLSFVIVVYGAGNGDLGIDCNATNADKDLCSLVFEGRSTAFASMTWQALILAWECLDPKKSLLLIPFSELWANQFLFWSIVGGFVTVFPVIYIPVINTKVFLHKSITWEWGLLLVLLHCSCWEQKLGNGASVCLLVAPKPKPGI